MAQIEKNPGLDWEVDYQYDGGEQKTMLVFGQPTIGDALREADYSLDSKLFADNGPYRVIAIRPALS